MVRVMPFQNHTTRGSESLPSIHTIGVLGLGRQQSNASPQHNHYGQNYMLHPPSPYQCPDHKLRPREDIDGRIETLRLRSPLNIHEIVPVHELDYDWVDVRAMQREGKFPYAEEDESGNISLIVEDKALKRLNGKGKDKVSSKCRKVFVPTKMEERDEETAEESEEDREGQDERNFEKSQQKNGTERNRRKREAALFVILERLINIENLGVRELSPTNKKNSGLNYPKEATLQATCDGWRRLEQEIDGLKRQNELLVQRLAVSQALQ